MKNVGMWILFLWLINSVMGLFVADVIASSLHIGGRPLRIFYCLGAVICGSALWGLFRSKQWGVKLAALIFSLATAYTLYRTLIFIVNSCSLSNLGFKISIGELVINSVFAYVFINLLRQKVTK